MDEDEYLAYMEYRKVMEEEEEKIRQVKDRVRDVYEPRADRLIREMNKGKISYLDFSWELEQMCAEAKRGLHPFTDMFADFKIWLEDFYQKKTGEALGTGNYGRNFHYSSQS